MRITVRVKAGSKKEMIEEIDDNNFVVKINQPAIEGKANKDLIEALAEYFNVSVSRIEIIKGEKSKNKVIEIYD